MFARSVWFSVVTFMTGVLSNVFSFVSAVLFFGIFGIAVLSAFSRKKCGVCGMRATNDWSFSSLPKRRMRVLLSSVMWSAEMMNAFILFLG